MKTETRESGMSRELLEKHGLQPKKELGQNFLSDSKVLEKEVETCEVGPEDTVLEIGGGTGNLTQKILDKSDKVVCIEPDERLVKVLKNRFEEEISQGRLQVLEDTFSNVKDSLKGVDKCVSNPPYYISQEVIEYLGSKGILSVLILQKEFVDKVVAKPGSTEYTFFSLLTNYYFIPVFVEKVGKHKFNPSPKIDSAIIKLFPRKKKFGVKDDEWMLKVGKVLFNNKMKKVRNSLVDGRHILEVSKDKIKGLRDEVPYSNERVVNLDVKKVADISKTLRSIL